MGYIETHRTGNTGVGKTFEDLMLIEENNSRKADYKNLIEIKTQREKSESHKTLFSRNPQPKGANGKLKKQFGYPDKKVKGQNILHTTVCHSEFNSCNNKWGFKLEIIDERIYLIVKDLATGKIVSDVSYWEFDTIKETIKEKCGIVAFINAKNKTIDGKEHFYYDSCDLVTFDFNSFIKAIMNDDIIVDIRIGIHSDGRTHDRGTAFRIKNIDSYFNLLTKIS